MSDFKVSVGADFSEVLNGFRKLPAEAQRAGESIGKGLDAGFNEAGKSIGELLTQIKALKAVQAKLPVDSSEYKKAQQDIVDLGRQIGELQRKKLALNADPSSIAALQAKLGDLRSELQQVAIGSQRFRELQQAIQSTERELQKAGDAADGMRILDGVIQGMAFSLTNTVTGAIGTALGQLQQFVQGFAQLDTEIRKAAAAGGDANGYDKLRGAIDRVGIEAAGTQLEVAQLSTELVRGGMTVDQATQSLAAIVRGAEATGTAYSRMAEVVAASIKIFGLQASDATRVVDALVQGANASATSASEMGMAFKYAGPVAKILGLSIEDLGIAVGLLANAGIPAAEAGVTLRNGLSKLASAAPQAGKGMQDMTGQAAMAMRTMRQLKLDIYNADGTLKPMEETLLRLKAAFQGLEPATKVRMAANLFGGEDDGAKWLSLLGLSVEEIKTLSATMANTKGATNTARDAMQGFEMATKQLGGTLDSLGNSVGRVAATALLPLLNAANTLVGAIAGLPDPVKNTAIAIGLVGGAAVAAAAGLVIFQRAMQVTLIQAAAAEIGSLAVAFRMTLVGGIQAAAAAVPVLLARFNALATTNVGVMLSSLATTLKTFVVEGFKNAAAAALALALKIQSIGWTGFISGARAAIAALGPLLLATAAISATVATWQYVMGGANDITNDFSGSQKELDKILGELEGTTRKAGQGIDGLGEKAKKNKPLLMQLAEPWRASREELTMLRASQEFEALQGGFTKVQQSALAFYSALRGSRSVTDEQKKRVGEYITQLKQIADIARERAGSLRTMAVQADRAGDDKLAAQFRTLAAALDSEEASARKTAGALGTLTAATRAATAAADGRLAATKAQIQAEDLHISRLQNQIALGQALTGLARGMGDVEQSRFSIVKNRLQFELSKLQEIGAGEDVINAKKAEADRVDREALSARYRNLILQQALEQRILEINQARARLDAQKGVNTAQLEVLKAEAELAKETDTTKRAGLQEALNAQRQALTIAQEQFGLLRQTQLIEAAISQLTAETARNGLQAEAASKGYRINADGTLAATSGITDSLGRVALLTEASADAQGRFREVAEQTGLAIGVNSQGTLILGNNQREVNQAVSETNALLAQSRSAFDATAQKAGAAGGAAGKIREGLDGAANPALRLAQAFSQTGDKAPAIAQGAQSFASYLGVAGNYASGIKGLNLDRSFSTVASSMSDAAGSAGEFYRYLQQASTLPGSRWTGGPVEAGAEYRVNELGQEAFLSAGRLSLIDAPANAVWRAPASGVVVPAGITARIRDAGMPAAGGVAPGGVAELAIEVGKLREEVGNLARRDWGVHVQMRTGPTTSQVMHQLQRLR